MSRQLVSDTLNLDKLLERLNQLEEAINDIPIGRAWKKRGPKPSLGVHSKSEPLLKPEPSFKVHPKLIDIPTSEPVEHKPELIPTPVKRSVASFSFGTKSS